METNEKAFLTQQLICMLPPLALKVMGYLLNWQKYDIIKYYPKQMCGFMHITEDELELALQTLEDNKLICISKIDGQFAIQLDKKMIMSYINVPMQKVHDHEGFKLATEVTWNKDELDALFEVPKEKKTDSIEAMSDEDLTKLLLRIEASLSERKQVKELVRSNEPNDLPF